MEKMLLEKLGLWTYLVVPFLTGIITSFVVEAIDLKTPDSVTPGILVLVSSIVVAVLLVIALPSFYDSLAIVLVACVLNIAFSVSFYRAAGQWTVKKVFSTWRQEAGKFSSKIN